MNEIGEPDHYLKIAIPSYSVNMVRSLVPLWVLTLPDGEKVGCALISGVSCEGFGSGGRLKRFKDVGCKEILIISTQNDLKISEGVKLMARTEGITVWKTETRGGLVNVVSGMVVASKGFRARSRAELDGGTTTKVFFEGIQGEILCKEFDLRRHGSDEDHVTLQKVLDWRDERFRGKSVWLVVVNGEKLWSFSAEGSYFGRRLKNCCYGLWNYLEMKNMRVESEWAIAAGWICARVAMGGSVGPVMMKVLELGIPEICLPVGFGSPETNFTNFPWVIEGLKTGKKVEDARGVEGEEEEEDDGDGESCEDEEDEDEDEDQDEEEGGEGARLCQVVVDTWQDYLSDDARSRVSKRVGSRYLVTIVQIRNVAEVNGVRSDRIDEIWVGTGAVIYDEMNGVLRCGKKSVKLGCWRRADFTEDDQLGSLVLRGALTLMDVDDETAEKVTRMHYRVVEFNEDKEMAAWLAARRGGA